MKPEHITPGLQVRIVWPHQSRVVPKRFTVEAVVRLPERTRPLVKLQGIDHVLVDPRVVHRADRPIHITDWPTDANGASVHNGHADPGDTEFQDLTNPHTGVAVIIDRDTILEKETA